MLIVSLTDEFANWAPLRYCTARWFFSPLQARQWYQTRGFKELALVHGVVEGSYRKTSALINRVRHQAEATPARRLCDTSQMEGQQLLSDMDRHADQILKEHEVTAEGTPPELLVRLSGCRADRLGEEEVQEAIARCDLAPDLKAEMAANPVPYEVPSSQVYVALDDIRVKQQKAHREPRPRVRPEKVKQQYVDTTIAHVEHDDAS